MGKRWIAPILRAALVMALVMALGVTLLGLPGAALAADCEKQIAAAERLIAEVGEKIDALPDEDRRLAQRFLDDASNVLEHAKRTCENATDGVDRALASSRVMIAVGNARAAELVAELQ